MPTVIFFENFSKQDLFQDLKLLHIKTSVTQCPKCVSFYIKRFQWPVVIGLEWTTFLVCRAFFLMLVQKRATIKYFAVMPLSKKCLKAFTTLFMSIKTAKERHVGYSLSGLHAVVWQPLHLQIFGRSASYTLHPFDKAGVNISLNMAQLFKLPDLQMLKMVLPRREKLTNSIAFLKALKSWIMWN